MLMWNKMYATYKINNELFCLRQCFQWENITSFVQRTRDQLPHRYSRKL